LTVVLSNCADIKWQKKIFRKLRFAAPGLMCAYSILVTTPVASPAASPLAVTIDGLVNEAAWQSPLSGRLAGPRCRAEGRWWIASDASALFFAAEISDRDIRGTRTELGAPVWGDDHVQLHIDNYYVFSFSPAGGQVSLPTGQAVKSAVSIKGKLNHSGDRDSGWSVEARIPWEAIGRQEPSASQSAKWKDRYINGTDWPAIDLQARPASYALNVAFQKGSHDPYDPFSDGWMNWNHAYWMWLSQSRVAFGAGQQETTDRLAHVEHILLNLGSDGREMTPARELLEQAQQAVSVHTFDQAWVLAAEACGAALKAVRPTERLDTNNDGKSDVLRTMWHQRYVTWIDDDGDLKPGDVTGDWDGDFMLVDSDGDGIHDNSADGKTLWQTKRDRAMDFWLQWVDLDNDQQWDILRHHSLKWPGFDRAMFEHHRRKNSPDGLNVMNWNTFGTFHPSDYNRTGPGWNYRTIYGRFNDLTLYIKIHPEFPHESWYSYDPDGDGASEIRVRTEDRPYQNEPSRGLIENTYITFDLENRITMTNQSDWGMVIRYRGGDGIDVKKYTNDLDRLAGLRQANREFLKGVPLESRETTRRAFLPLTEAYQLVVNANWGSAEISWNEDHDDRLPEGILSPSGPWGDALGDRTEMDVDFSGRGQIYRSPLDEKLHLFGAEKGQWKQDPDGHYYGKSLIDLIWGVGYCDYYWDPRDYQVPPPVDLKPSTITYEDQNKNGYFDLMRIDSDGDGQFERQVNMLGPDSKPDADIGPTISLNAPYAELTRFAQKRQTGE